MRGFLHSSNVSTKLIKLLYLTNFYILLKIFVKENNLNSFLLGSRGFFFIISIRKFLISIRRSFSFLKRVLDQNGRIVFIGSNELKMDSTYLKLKTNLILNKHLCFSKWKAGSLTNMKGTKEISLKFLKVRDKNRQVFSFFKNYEASCFLKNRPNVFVILDAGENLDALKEASKFNIPVISLVNDSSLIRYVTYPILCNVKSTYFVSFFISLFLSFLLSEQLLVFKSFKIKRFLRVKK